MQCRVKRTFLDWPFVKRSLPRTQSVEREPVSMVTEVYLAKDEGLNSIENSKDLQKTE